MKNKKAVTLMELVIIIIILGILAGLLLPSFKRIRERTMDKEAIAGLQLIYNAERVYMEKHQTPYPPSWIVTNLSWINGNLSLDLISKNWQFNIGSNSYSYQAQAARTSGPCIGRVWSINASNDTPSCLGACCP